MTQVLPPALTAMLPESADAYLGLLVDYNQSAWPAHLLAIAGAIGVYELTRTRYHDRTGLLMFVLACAWAWSGWSFLRTQMGADQVIVLLYMLQAVMLLVAVLFNPPLRPDSASSRAGHALVVTAVVVLPVLVLLQARSVLEIPYFGLSPMVTAMATLGAVMALAGWFRWVLAIIPILWLALIGYGAAEIDSLQLALGPICAGVALLVAAVGSGPQQPANA